MKKQETMPVYEAPTSKVIHVRLQHVMCQSVTPEGFNETPFDF